jgi:hypothetical protein
MGYTVKESRFDSWQVQEILVLKSFQTCPGTRPTSCAVGSGGSFPWGEGIMRTGYETDHISPRSVQIKGCVELYRHPSLISHHGAEWNTVRCIDHSCIQHILKICLLQTAVHLYKVSLFQSLKYVVNVARIICLTKAL